MQNTLTNTQTSNTNFYQQTKNTLKLLQTNQKQPLLRPPKPIKTKHQNQKVISKNQSLNTRAVAETNLVPNRCKTPPKEPSNLPKTRVTAPCFSSTVERN